MINQAFILAAGFGTRLAPLTNQIPKPLLPVAGRPLLGLILDHLESQGLSRIGLNAHHLADQVQQFVLNRERKVSVYVEQDQILGTGGGLGQIRNEFGHDTVMVINGDVIFDLDLAALGQAHKDSGAMVTMVLHDRPGLNLISLAEDRITGFGNSSPGIPKNDQNRYAYTCLQFLEPLAFDYLPHDRPGDLIKAYKKMINDGLFIRGHVVTPPPFWTDMGTPGDYINLHRDLLINHCSAFGYAPQGPIHVQCGGKIHSQAKVTGFAAVGREAIIQQNARIEDSVIMDGAVIFDGAEVIRSIIGPGCVVTDSISDLAITAK